MALKINKKQPKGFTLVELMVVLVILGIVSIGAMTAIISQSRVYHSEEDIIDMQMNARVAMDRICFLLRMAGVGCSDSFGNKLNSGDLVTYSKSDDDDSPIYPVYNDGSSNDELNAMFVAEDNAGVDGSDKLTLVGAVRHIGDILPPNPLPTPPISDPPPSAPGIPANNQIKVRLGSPNLELDGGISAKTYIFISPHDDNKFRTISSVSSTDTFATLTLSTSLETEEQKEMENNLAIGTVLSVYQVQAFTIRLVNNSLRIDDNIVGSSTQLDVADNIQDLQFEYGIDTDTPPDGQINTWVGDMTNPAHKIAQIKAVRIFILARTGKFDKEYVDRKTYTYPDGTSVSFAGNDNFSNLNTSEHVHRYILENTVAVRNRNL